MLISKTSMGGTLIRKEGYVVIREDCYSLKTRKFADLNLLKTCSATIKSSGIEKII